MSHSQFLAPSFFLRQMKLGLAETGDACISSMCIIPNLYAQPNYTVLCTWLKECVCVWNCVCQLPPMHHRASEECEERSRDEDRERRRGRVVFAVWQSCFSLCIPFSSAVVCQCALLGSSKVTRQWGWVKYTGFTSVLNISTLGRQCSTDAFQITLQNKLPLLTEIQIAPSLLAMNE